MTWGNEFARSWDKGSATSAVKEHNQEQTSSLQPKSGSENVKPAVSVKRVNYSTIAKWKLDRLEIEVITAKIPRITTTYWLEC